MTESVKQVLYTTNLFANNKNITSVNLNNATFVNGNMVNTFRGCNALTQVTNIGRNVTNMAYAFYGCNAITSIPSIPNTVTNMHACFDTCNALSYTPALPNSVKNIDWCFANTNINTTPNIPETVTSLANTFYRCFNLTTITNIPNTVTDMYGTFSYCSKLTNIPTIPSSVTNLASTFYGCNGLTNVQNIPNTVTSLSSTFAYCNNLTRITIPNSVTSMYGTFSECKSLAIPPVIPNSVTSMGSTFSGCTGLTSFPNIPEHITSYQSMFSGCTQFTSFYQVPQNTTYMYGIFSGCNNMSGTYNIPSTVSGSLNYAFNGCTKLTGSITIPENVDSCSSSFQSCTNLTDIAFNCKDVNLDHCCNNCTSLRNVTFNCENIRNTWYAFRNCNNLTNVNGFINNGNLGWAFDNLKNLKNVNLTIGTIQNGSRLFSNCRNLTDVNISVNSINNAAYIFNGCTNLTRFIDIPGATNLEYAYANMSIPTTPPNISSDVKYMSDTFQNCFNLTDMPNLSNCINLISMGWTFSNCTNLRNVTTLPNSVTAMYYTFGNCTNLTTAPIIPDNVTQANSTFYNCQSLTGNIYINSSKILYSSQMFDNTSLSKNVYIPYTYNNGAYTNTYNSLSSQYTETGSVNGVYLKPNFMYLNMSIPSDSTLYVNGDIVVDPQKLTICEDTDYVLIKEGYAPYTKHVIYQAGLATDTILESDLPTDGVTLIITPTQEGTTVELNYLGLISTSNTCKVVSGTEITYTVKKLGYKKEVQTIILTEDVTIEVTLEESEIPTNKGDRIKNMATVLGTFTDNSGKSYVYAVLDSTYRNFRAPGGLPVKDFDYEEYESGTYPDLPGYYNATTVTTLGATESATHNTNVMVDYYSDYNPYDSEYYRLHPEELPEGYENYKLETIFSIARETATVVLDNITFNTQLPNAYELNEIWQNKNYLDSLDPTVVNNPSKSLNVAFDENEDNLRVWSSTLGYASMELEFWAVGKRWDDPIALEIMWSYYNNNKVIPIFEIPLD